jgi:5-methyltetrahydrofolate--homocysteine methyltransferase
MVIAAKAMKNGLRVLEPFVTKGNAEPRGTVVTGTVKGDLHDIGKNLVGMMLEGAGFNVIDLGMDVMHEDSCAAAEENGARIIAMSALLTTTMPGMARVVKRPKDRRLPCKIIIGGAPVI